MRSFKCTTICWILSCSVLCEYALCSESQRLLSDILELLCDCTELCKCCRLTDCVYSQCESGDYGFSVQTTPQRLVVCSPQSTLANWRLNPLNLDKERNYCNVNTSSTIPCFTPRTWLVAQLSKFKYARTSSGERLPSSFLSLNCWALIKLHFFRKVLTRAGGGVPRPVWLNRLRSPTVRFLLHKLSVNVFSEILGRFGQDNTTSNWNA